MGQVGMASELLESETGREASGVNLNTVRLESAVKFSGEI